ncbi:adaptor protein MecA [Alkalicoccobacillus murimartini]|uniref:Adapter protein MecA n=1 Tax=Alkalicoccobacillus murimartini TaxID=171685 RepID=A0ABT9YJ46_9BACI|nr:adaptor protein MecA [Alkalicoccobacillus murimartini]MDQ0207891.1 adapter protein MecA 1/2 [Alkalicoccobacillus murimartini]
MEIERVNDTTIKFFITYKDIESRGFERDEIWYNRERGEELFFEMMNEANNRDDFELDGPLWIQVHALDRGLEILVTRGQVSDGNMKLEVPDWKDKNSLDEDSQTSDEVSQVLEQDEGESEPLELMIGFRDFEDIIDLSHSFVGPNLDNRLFHFEGQYFLHILFDDEQYSEDEQDNMLSHILEYGFESDITIHRVQEYGKCILEAEALGALRSQFAMR